MHWTQKESQQESGFTLVELLVVILIIGVLAAIAIPAFMYQRERANVAALESDLHNVASAFQTWQINHPNDRLISSHGWGFILSDENGPRVDDLDIVALPGSFQELAPTLSNGSSVGMLNGSADTNIHTGPPGSFCLVGNMINTNYDFSGTPKEKVNSSLYYNYNESGGGIKAPDELESGDACWNYYNRHNSGQ